MLQPLKQRLANCPVQNENALNHSPSAASRLQRIQAKGRVSAVCKEGRSRLDRLYQEGSAKIRLPRVPGSTLEAVLINTGGGLTGGDRLEWDVEAGPGAALVATTQACEKVYRSPEGEARVTCRLKAGENGFLAWLPQETILFDASALSRTLEVDLAASARALIVEATIFGRTAMGERVRQARFRDRWRVRVDGRLVHAEDLAVEGGVDALLARAAIGNGAVAIATVLMVDRDAEAKLPAVRDMIGPGDGASAWTVGKSGKLLARLAATDGHGLRQRLIPLLRLLSEKAGLPRIWSS